MAICDCVERTAQLHQAVEKLEAQVSYYGAEHPAFPLVPDSQLATVTMELFLSEMAKEKPIRFAPQQLAGFTQNFSKVLGSGGFGIVYKGEFPNGVQVAVKVLKNILGKRIEE
ncbi:hypothetical protein Ancab_004993 [Ancistrocladus abbreviatus]